MGFISLPRRGTSMRFVMVKSSAKVALAAGALTAAACTHSSNSSAGGAPAPTREMSAHDMSTSPPSPDPRVGLKAGLWDAGQAAWNVRLVSTNRPSDKFLGTNQGVNSDMAFTGKYVIQGNFNGFQVWDVSDPANVKLRKAYYCPASQSDVSVYKNLLLVSSKGTEGRIDCGGEGVKDTASPQRLRGIRIFDISD